MSSKKLFRRVLPSSWSRERLRATYLEKYFNLYLNKYKIEGATREEREYILRKFWERGAVCAFRIGDDMLAFATFAPQNFNIYNFPTEVIAVNERGVSYIPSRPLKTGVLRLNEAREVEEPEVVIVYAQHSRQPIGAIVEDYVDRIVEVEMTIRTNLFAQKIPVAYKTTPENKSKMEELARAILNDDPTVTIGVDDIASVEALKPEAPLILAELYDYKTQLESELQTFLGFDNMASPKKERLAVDEANANNEVINDYEDAVLDVMSEGFELVNEAFGSSYRVYVKEPEVDSFHDEEENPDAEEGGKEEKSNVE